MGFSFRFERLLAYREEMEKRAMVEVARVERYRDHERKGLITLHQEVDKLGYRWAKLRGRSILMDDIQLIRGRWVALQNDVNRQQSVVDEWELRLEEARQRLVQARRSKKVMMVLKDQALRGYLAAVEKAEADHLDEVSLRPYWEGAAHCDRG